MTTRAVARRKPAIQQTDAAIAEAEAQAVVIWRGERIRFADLPERIARTEQRAARDRMYIAYLEAVDQLNPLYERRLSEWTASGNPVDAAAKAGNDPRDLAVSLERFSLNAETPYYAALRRYLALIGIEQGDATEADLWHVVRGAEWDGWFGEREVTAALAAAGRPAADAGELTGWRAAERQLAGTPDGSGPVGANAVSRAFASLVASPEWLVDEMRVDSDQAIAFVDFATFVRLWRIRRLIGQLMYELRLYSTDDAALQRAYHQGILSSMTGVIVSEAEYLASIDAPLASVTKIESGLLAGMLVEVLEQRYGTRWWRDPASAELTAHIGQVESRADALAELGYDALDWRPVLRQIRTRLIGEMSGYGGPNITTRAGTRKV
ncbi:MAG TPA: hypothetical protein VJ975_06565 [Candidatus Limnocylindria bacterium]|nr:hypothetical protein [Candidatus Limnocylindria bacterium]